MDEVLHRQADPIKVKLIKGQKDTYGWEISVQGNDAAQILIKAREIDATLRLGYAEKLGS